MDLGLTKRGDYAVRAAISLAQFYGNGYRKIREVAQEMDLPVRYTPQILGLLNRAGLAEARAGRDGGYRLSRDPNEISLLEVVEAAEGELTSARCTLSGGPCRWDVTCAVHDSWVAAREAFKESLSRSTLAAVAAEDARLARASD